MYVFLGIVFSGAMIILAIAQIVVGFLGIEHTIGPGWAWGALALGFILRLTLPLTIGSFFGATEVLGWHWLPALLFAAPGLLFIIPGMATSIFDAFRKA